MRACLLFVVLAAWPAHAGEDDDRSWGVHPDTNREVHPDTNREVHPDTNREVHPDTNREVHPAKRWGVDPGEDEDSKEMPQLPVLPLRLPQPLRWEGDPIPKRETEEAVRKREGEKSKAKSTAAPAPPKVEYRDDVEAPDPREPWKPCMFNGTGGPGPSKQRPVADWIHCRYQCGKYQVQFYIFGKRSEECGEKRHLDRAEALAEDKHREGT